MAPEPMTLTFANAFIGALGSGALLGLAALVKHIGSLGKQTERLASKIDKLIETDEEQTEAIYIIAKIQRPQLAAHKATLEALKGECNGNVDRAHEAILESTKEFDDYLVKRLEKVGKK